MNGDFPPNSSDSRLPEPAVASRAWRDRGRADADAEIPAMTRQESISTVGWEDHLLKFLRAEMAPTPGRAQAAARIVVACLVTTVLVMTMHSPHASYALVTIFVISQTNAGASLSKALLRILGTAFGAAVGMTAYIAFLDHPWFASRCWDHWQLFSCFFPRPLPLPISDCWQGLLPSWS